PRRHGQISRAVSVRRIDGSRSWDRGGGGERSRALARVRELGAPRFRRAALAQEGAPIVRDLRAGKRTGALERQAVCGASRLSRKMRRPRAASREQTRGFPEESGPSPGWGPRLLGISALANGSVL